MRVGVVTFPGSCDDRDAAYALELLGMEPVPLWHAEPDLRGVDAVVLPGGFSHGDYLRTGALARFAPVMAPIAEFAAIGGPVVGICNGFQILCEAGLLPGALTRNANLRFVARPAAIRIEATGDVLTIPVKHGEGRYVHDDPDTLAANGQVLARYLDDPNGSVAAIAGVTNAPGNVAGLMPHPEHAVDPLLGPTDGRRLLTSLLRRAA
jgi:phosphoribosylformylglycinamidine synthase I